MQDGTSYLVFDHSVDLRLGHPPILRNLTHDTIYGKCITNYPTEFATATSAVVHCILDFFLISMSGHNGEYFEVAM